VDARSDIFSFGSMLYEMVSGQRAFKGDSNLAILTTILREEPRPIRQLVPNIPPDLEKIINRCLRKDPDRRFQAMPDLKVALQELKEESGSIKLAATDVAQLPSRRGTKWTVGLPTLFCVVALVTWFALSTGKGPPQAPLAVVPLTSYPGEERQPSFSPDGNQVAFSWNGEKQDNFDIYVKLIGPGTQLRLTTASERDSNPAWSPDGRSIAFLRETPGAKDSVHLVSPLGPPERKVAEISRTGAGTDLANRLAWTPDGKRLVVTDRNSDSEALGLFLLSVESGERQRLTSAPDQRFVDSDPAFSPDGGTLAFIREVGFVSDVYLLALSEDFQPIGEPKRLTFENQPTFRPIWTSDGREIIFSSGSFLSPSVFRISVASGKPQPLAGVGEDGSEAAISHRTLRLVYTRELLDANIWRVEIPGPHEKRSSPEKLIFSTRLEGDPQFSPDGKRIVFNSNRTGNFQIWICNSDGSHPSKLTSLGGSHFGSARWSPDNEHITFDSNAEGQWEIYVTNANGDKPKRITNNPGNDIQPSWSRDGKRIYFASDRSGEYQVWQTSAGGDEPVPVTRKGGLANIESPDGKWVYYAKSWEGPLWKVPRDGGEEIQVLEWVQQSFFAIVTEGIYFIQRPDSAGRYSIQFFNFATKRIRYVTTIERPAFLYLSASPDGRFLLFSQIDQSGSDLMLVENFH